MPVVDPGSRICLPDRSNYHFRMFVVDDLVYQGKDDTEVHISEVMEDGASSRASPNYFDFVFWHGFIPLQKGAERSCISSDQGMVDFKPGILIRADDDAWLVHVE